MRLEQTILRTAVAGVLLLAGTQGFTQQKFIIPRITGPVNLDGYSDEAAWQAIDPLPLTMYTPTFRGAPTERTEIRVAHDDNFIYMAGRLYDSEPEKIQANSLVRDLDRGGDFFNLILDTFNDNENILIFATTPAGNRLDGEATNDAEGPQQQFWNQDWNAFWDNAVAQDARGWFVEVRVPFSSLRFQNDGDEVVFGMMVHRLIARKNERLTFPAIPPNWAAGQWKASRAQDVVLRGIKSKRPLYLTPYLLAGAQRSSIVQDPSGYQTNLNKEAGIDLKYGLSNNANLDITVNTDFAQVEADDEQINLTRFSLFFPEKRQFFQERSGIFSFKTGGDTRLFHSRRIGLTRAGGPVRIFGGARLVGRAGTWDFGLLDLHADATAGEPATNFGVFRLRRRVANQYSYVGAMVTSKVAAGGVLNFNSGFDTVLRVTGNDYLTMNLVTTFIDSSSAAFDATMQRVAWQRRSVNGLGYEIAAQHIGRNFDPALGFQIRSGVYQLKGELSFGLFASNASKIRKHIPALSGSLVRRKGTKETESSLLEVVWDIEAKSGAGASFYLSRQYESLLTGFRIDSDAGVPVGDYTFYNARAKYFMSGGRLLRTSLNVQAGQFFDGNQLSFSISPTWNQSRHFEIGVDFEHNRLRFSKRDVATDVNLVRLRLRGALNVKFSGNGLLQYNSAENKINLNFRLRYNFREGHDFYFVYNETFNSERTRTVPRLPLSDSRTVLVKYNYTLVR